MKTIKTPKGTELPLLEIQRRKKNKITQQWENLPPTQYLQVAHRLVWFREEHPEWSIETKLVHRTENETMVCAMIKNENGRVIAEAHKVETAADWGDHTEKAETGAIGRALAHCGYGTQFAPEILEDTDVVDSPQATKRVTQVPQAKGQPLEAAPKSEPAGEPQKPLITEAQVKRLYTIATTNKWTHDEVKDFLINKYKVSSSKELTRSDYEHIVLWIENNSYEQTMQHWKRSQ